jgi:general secretion pathway protein D
MKFRVAAFMVALATVAIAPAEDAVSLNFQNADVHEVLAYYERLTRCQLVLDNQIVGPLSLKTPAPVAIAKAIELIEATLFANGFPLVQIKPDTIRVFGIGKNVRDGPIPTVTTLEDLPSSERVVTYLCKLKHRDPTEMVQVLQQHLTPSSNGISSLTVDYPVRAIIITDRTSSLREVIKLIGELDQPTAK